MSIIGGGSESELICGQAVSTPPDLPPPSSLSVFGHLPPHPHPCGGNHISHFIPASAIGSYHPQFNPQFNPPLGHYHPNSVPTHFNSSYARDHVSAQFHHPHHQMHPATGQLSTSGQTFIKQEPDQQYSLIKQECGVPFIKQEPGVIPSWDTSFNHTGGGDLHVESEPQDTVIAPIIKQELAGDLSESGHFAAGSFIKQEPRGSYSLIGQNSLCAYGDYQQQGSEACTGVSFPTQPLNLNFMADIEDIVPSATPELTINSIQQELSSFDGPSDVKASHRRVSLVRVEQEEKDCEPPLWKQQYENIRTMRSKRDAPVDKYGCFMNAEKEVPPEVRRYQVLVSLMLSSQTKDEVVSKAMTKLKENGLTISNVISTPQEEIARMIFPVGFWNKKAEYIKKTTAILEAKFGGDIPDSVQGLVSLRGIGPKMAHLIMDFAWGEVSGIAVDTHVHRITHRLGWMQREARNPEEARKYLEKWLPKSEWSDLNLLCVGFGQQVCLPVSPKCSECMNKDLCPSSSCLVSTGLPLGIGFEISTKSKSKKAKSTLASSDKRHSKKIKIERK